MALGIEGQTIARIAFEGESCAICKASASMMTVAVKGKALPQAPTYHPIARTHHDSAAYAAGGSVMPKIAEIEDTPNLNAVKFTLHEPLTWGISHSFENAGQAAGDALASALFAI